MNRRSFFALLAAAPAVGAVAVAAKAVEKQAPVYQARIIWRAPNGLVGSGNLIPYPLAQQWVNFARSEHSPFEYWIVVYR